MTDYSTNFYYTQQQKKHRTCYPDTRHDLDCLQFLLLIVTEFDL